LPKLLVFKAVCHYRQRLERYLGGEGMGVRSPMEFGTIDGVIWLYRRRARDFDAAAIGGRALGASPVETQFVPHKAQMRSLALRA
jgi:hypothetical protein